MARTARSNLRHVVGPQRQRHLPPGLVQQRRPLPRPGSAPDYIWDGLAPGASAPESNTAITINGTYEPIALGTGFILYAPGPSGDYLIYDVSAGGVLETIPGTINGTYTTAISSPSVRAFPVWHAPGPGGDFFWAPSASVARGNLGWAREAPQASFTMPADG